jgi:hypothetical protein
MAGNWPPTPKACAHFVDEMRKDAAVKMDAILKPVAVKVAVKQEEVKPS